MNIDGRVGTQADLHSFGLSLLQAAYGRVGIDTIHPPEARTKNSLDLSAAALQKRLIKLAGPGTDAQTQAQALQFLADARDPSSMAHLIMRCMDMANTVSTPPACWADRKFSGAQLQSLVDHPALREVQ
jgi:hypothetical protein